MCFLLEADTKKLIYTIYLKVVLSPIKYNSLCLEYFILFEQTPRDIILLFHDIAEVEMNLEQWKQLCRKAWENDYDHLQIDRFSKRWEGRYTIRKCIKNAFIECIPETQIFG